MKIQGEFLFDGPREQVWEMLQDPEVLARAMPGTRKLEKTGPDTYEGAIELKIGPVNDVFSGKVVLRDQQPPESYTMQVDGKGNSGFARVTARVQLQEAEPGKTRIQYQAQLQVGGRLSSVGQRLLDSVGRSLIRQSFEAINQQLIARTTGEEAAAAAPTTGQVARRVASDVLKETIRNNPIIALAIIVLVVLFILWLILRSST